MKLQNYFQGILLIMCYTVASTDAIVGFGYFQCYILPGTVFLLLC